MIKEFSSAYNAIFIRFAIIFGLSILGWLVAELFIEELERLHFGIIAVAAILLAPRYSSYTQQDQKVHCLKWWGFKYFEKKK
ncbi:MAG: hypothetical protein LAT51_01020 [Flavobacteriaceae bacterium]|nr:hypothetical protein [Flavobacteriaceae bacterium]